jgi:hypothetical protein
MLTEGTVTGLMLTEGTVTGLVLTEGTVTHAMSNLFFGCDVYFRAD